jgi:hypothetical protein
VLVLMAEGLYDDAIARRAGISTTTVRRHITAIMNWLGASSRFAAGAAAQRRVGSGSSIRTQHSSCGVRNSVATFTQPRSARSVTMNQLTGLV